MLQVSARQEKTKYTIRASFLEIYNEQVRDLWNPSSGALSIREYPPGYWRGFYVEDLYIFECTNVDDMLFKPLVKPASELTCYGWLCV